MKRLLLVVIATMLAFNWLSAEVGTPKDGMALTFDGANDYLRVEAAPEIEALNELTVETWVYLRSYSTYQTFITGECDLTYYSWTLREGDDADGKVVFVVCGADQSYEYVLTESGSIPLNTWTHVAGVFDNEANTITVYVNGENVGSKAFTGPMYPSNEGMFLGRYPNDNSAYLNGSLDNTAVWNTVRTQAEIKETMHRKLKGDEDGLLAYYDYDFEDGTIVKDKAGSFDATLNNMDEEDWVRSGVTMLESPLGTGTSDDPYQIASFENLMWLSETSAAWDKYFSQTADINASQTDTLNDGAGFSPIGGSTVPFSGVYMGNGHTIDSLYINRPEQDYIGFFGITKASSTTTISNLGLTAVDITGHDHTGGFLGTGETNSTNRAIISECFVTGKVDGNFCIGGFVGHAKSTQITNSYSIVDVRATGDYSGGFTGSTWYGLISNCYSTGEINGTTNVGGFTAFDPNANHCFWNTEISGINTSTCGTPLTNDEMQTPLIFINNEWDFISESHNGTDSIWGINETDNNGYPFLAWQNLENTNQDLERPTISAISDQFITYSSDDESAEIIDFTSLVQDSTTDNTTTKENLIITQSIAAGTMINTSTDITVTAQDEAGNVSDLITFSIILKPSDLIGEGTEASPYEIANLDHLKWLSKTSIVWDKHISQTADINASQTKALNDGKGFSPIGTRTIPFSGVYNGNGHIIDSLYINRPAQNDISFFGISKASSATNITKLGLTNVNITGYDAVGGFLGTGETNSTNRAVISECFVTGKVSGHYAIGGFSGGALAMQISNCYSIVKVNATGTYCGGFTGTSWYGLINNCYCTGEIIATTNVGGFTPYDYNATNCFWNTEISGINTSTCGTPLTNDEMTMPCTFYEAGWDFMAESNNGTDNVWGINNTDNNGYPFLAWQNFNNTVLDFERPIISTINDQITVYDSDKDSAEIIDFTLLVQDSTTDNTTTKENLIITQSIAAGTMINSSTDITVTAQDEAGNVSDSITFSINMKPSDLIGEGTEASPYEIASLCHLKWLSNNSWAWVQKHFIQTADIDASETSTWNNGAGFVGIGVDNDNLFDNCYYNGDNFEIKNLVINRPSTNYIGLFRNVKGGKISNLSVVDASIVGGSYVGVLAGSFAVDNAIMENCFTSGSVSGVKSVGGIVGNFYTASINNSFSSASVTGTGDSAGGIFGYAYNSTINNIYATGSVIGNMKVGGLIGYLRRGTVNNSYCTGAVTGNTEVGGFTGFVYANPVVTNSYWDMTISGQAASTSGTGKTTTEMTMPYTFYEASWDLMNETNNGEDDIWGINPDANGGYPFLKSQGFTSVTDYVRPEVSAISAQVTDYNCDGSIFTIPDYTILVQDSTTENTTAKENLVIIQSIAAGTEHNGLVEITVTAQDEAGNISKPIVFTLDLKPSDMIGEGTEARPYEIASLCHLRWLSTNTSVWVGKYFIQTNDINAKDTENWNEGKGFACIGSTVENFNGDCFEGSYDGQGHIIDSLYINRPSESVVGLFASCKNSTIKKLGLTNASVIGGKYAGILKGVDYNNWQSIVDQCFTTGVVAGTYSVGGLIGHNGRTSLTNSYSTAQVNAVTATYSGGLCGVNYVSSNINNCYSTGLVNSTSGYSFGFSGENGYSSTINNCFWDIESSNKTTSAGGIGKATIDMHSPSTFADAGWDFINESNNGFDDIWGINPDVNDGYPFLTWQGLTSVADYVKPEVSAIANQEVLQEANSSNGVLPDFSTLVIATDNATEFANLVISQSPAAGTVISGENNTVTMTVKDEAANYNTTTFTVKVVNKAPEFDAVSSTLSIPENSSAGTTLVTVSATDENGDDLCYSTTATEVAIDESTGIVTILDATYFEKGKNTNISFEVKVSDGTLEDIETVTISISVATSVSCQWSNQDVVLYPNPAKDNVTLKLPKYENEVVIELININGTVVLKQNVLNEKTSFNTSNLCSGMYILLITTDNTTIQKQLLIK